MALTHSRDALAPLVLVPVCNRQVGLSEMAVIGKTYIDAVRFAGARALVIPDADAADIVPLLDLVDGIFLPGSPSNVHASEYGQEVQGTDQMFDTQRDSLTLPLIRTAIDLGVPLLAVCRGFQEFNVAMGGTLHQKVHEVPGYMDHRSASEESMEEKYALAHEVELAAGGMLEEWLVQKTWMVNTIHWQGIDRLADGLRAEAFAPDGLVEAITVPGAKAFNLGVQWHPEWKVEENDLSRCLFGKFGEACRERHLAKAALTA